MVSRKQCCYALALFCTSFIGAACFAQAADDWRLETIKAAGRIAVGRPVTMQGSMFIALYEPATGIELWRSDGTVEGTQLVKDINPGPQHSQPGDLVVVGERLFFRANDGLHGDELWSSDGTETGTVMLQDVFPGPESSVPILLTPAPQGKLYFNAYSPGAGRELWVYDGITQQTRQVRDIRAGETGSNPASFVVYGEQIFFKAADAAHGDELWVSDGTEAGTRLAVDVLPGAAGSAPSSLAVFADLLFFRVYDAVLGPTLYLSDGTPEGTALLPGYVPGRALLNWVAPTHNADGSVYTNPAGYRIRYWTDTSPMRTIDIVDPTQLSFAITGLPPGNYSFGITSVNADAEESTLSATVSKRLF